MCHLFGSIGKDSLLKMQSNVGADVLIVEIGGSRQPPFGERLPVRLKACLIGEVEVLFRYTLSGL